MPLLAFEGSESQAVGYQCHAYSPRVGSAAVMEGSMRILEKEHVVAWLWLAGAGADDKKPVYSLAPSQW